MACVLTTGRAEPCKDAKSGIKSAYFADFFESSFTASAGQATAMDAALTAAFNYALVGDNNTFDEEIVSSTENGTTIVNQTLTISLKKQDAATAAEIALIAKARPLIIVKDNAGDYRVMGLSDGTLTNGTINSGGAKGDFNGYNLTFTATETDPAPVLDSSTKTAFEAVISATQITP